MRKIGELTESEEQEYRAIIATTNSIVTQKNKLNNRREEFSESVFARLGVQIPAITKFENGEIYEASVKDMLEINNERESNDDI